MKYEKEYQVSNNREEFISILLKKYKIKKATALRRWYDYYKLPRTQIDNLPIGIEEEHIKELRHTKKIELRDMIKFKLSLSDNMLKKHGFYFEEINWIKLNKEKLNAI